MNSDGSFEEPHINHERHFSYFNSGVRSKNPSETAEMKMTANTMLNRVKRGVTEQARKTI
jgi:hypothetical protein